MSIGPPRHWSASLHSNPWSWVGRTSEPPSTRPGPIWSFQLAQKNIMHNFSWLLSLNSRFARDCPRLLLRPRVWFSVGGEDEEDGHQVDPAAVGEEEVRDQPPAGAGQSRGPGQQQQLGASQGPRNWRAYRGSSKFPIMWLKGRHGVLQTCGLRTTERQNLGQSLDRSAVFEIMHPIALMSCNPHHVSWNVEYAVFVIAGHSWVTLALWLHTFLDTRLMLIDILIC